MDRKTEEIDEMKILKERFTQKLQENDDDDDYNDNDDFQNFEVEASLSNQKRKKDKGKCLQIMRSVCKTSKRVL